MDGITELLNKRIERLEGVVIHAQERIKDLPSGRLRASNFQGKTRYYYVCEGQIGNGAYIHEDNLELARKLAQKDYLEKIVAAAEKELAIIRRAVESYPKEVPETVYYDLRPERKALVPPLFLNDEDYVKWWLSESYRDNPFEPEEKCYATKRGDLVRSKSEAMIADAYYELGIPYKYEYPIEVSPGVTRFADFAVLDIRNRKVYYHEHFGLLDHPDYLKKNMRKLKEYRGVGIFTGKNLILTHEIDGCPLDMNLFRQNTAEFFGRPFS